MQDRQTDRQTDRQAVTQRQTQGGHSPVIIKLPDFSRHFK